MTTPNVLPVWKTKGSRFYIPTWKRPFVFLKRKFWYMKYPHYWTNLLRYGWKQFLPSNPKVGDGASGESGLGGEITAITDTYIEVSGIYVYPTGNDDDPGNDWESWEFRYDRSKLGKLWRRPYRRRDQWELNGKPLITN